MAGGLAPKSMINGPAACHRNVRSYLVSGKLYVGFRRAEGREMGARRARRLTPAGETCR